MATPTGPEHGCSGSTPTLLEKFGDSQVLETFEHGQAEFISTWGAFIPVLEGEEEAVRRLDLPAYLCELTTLYTLNNGCFKKIQCLWVQENWASLRFLPQAKREDKAQGLRHRYETMECTPTCLMRGVRV